MEEWKEYKASEFCESVTDGTHDSPKSKDKGFYLITSKHLKDSYIDFASAKFISREDYQKVIQRSKVEQYDVLFSMIGTIGNTLRVTSPKIEFAVKNMGIFKFGGNNLNSKWFYYWLKSPKAKEYIKSRLSGSTQSYLTLNSLRDFPVLCPDNKTKKDIISILSSLDDKIELNRRINENLEQQAQALFKSWFVDFEPFKGGKFVDSELGMIPEEWRVGYYTELVDIKGGGTPKTNIEEYWNGDIPFFSPKDVDSNCFVLDTEKHITAMGLDNCNSNLFPSKTVFITARGTVGKIVMAGTEMAMNQTNYALLGKHNVSQYYVYLITLQLVTRLLKKANGAVFNAITTRDFTNERIVIPFNSIIKSFSSIVEPLYENILLNEFQIKRLSQLRDTLLPRLMSGKLQI